MTGEPDGVPGLVVSIQTFGNRAGNYHPHIHCLATDGVHLPDGTFVRSSFLPPVDIAELFRREVLRTFLERELVTESVAENMLSWPHSGFHVHLGPVISGDERKELKRTTRYGARTPIALSRLSFDREREEIAYTYTNPYDHSDYTEKVTPYELIARLVTHIPDPWEQNNRYFGFYSNRTRGKRRSGDSPRRQTDEEREGRAPRKDPRPPEREGNRRPGGTIRRLYRLNLSSFLPGESGIPLKGFVCPGAGILPVVVFRGVVSLRNNSRNFA